MSNTKPKRWNVSINLRRTPFLRDQVSNDRVNKEGLRRRKFIWKPGDVEIQPATEEELEYLRKRKAEEELEKGAA